ncbi:MAG: type II toxin-antitoxin system CcdA family antitoxin [Thermoplasmatota archaeon]
MPTVSVRVEQTDLKEARRYKINVSQAFRDGLAHELRKARVAASVKRLASVAVKPSAPAVEQVRRLRDGRLS